MEYRTLLSPILFSMSQCIGLSHTLGILRQTTLAKIRALTSMQSSELAACFYKHSGHCNLRWVETMKGAGMSFCYTDILAASVTAWTATIWDLGRSTYHKIHISCDQTGFRLPNWLYRLSNHESREKEHPNLCGYSQGSSKSFPIKGPIKMPPSMT